LEVLEGGVEVVLECGKADNMKVAGFWGEEWVCRMSGLVNKSYCLG